MSQIGIDRPVTNFPPWYPWYKKIWSNITYWFSQIPLSSRKNNLTKSDIKNIQKSLKTGDIILGGNFREASQVLIGWIVTHAIAYIGKRKCIHVGAHGVSFISLKKISRTYDTVFILRPYWDSGRQVERYREIFISKLGKPYDFFFWAKEDHEQAYFCTQLINDSIREAWYDTLLDSIQDPKDAIDVVFDKTFQAHRVLRPEGMIYGRFETVFHSHNIKRENERYILIQIEMSSRARR